MLRCWKVYYQLPALSLNKRFYVVVLSKTVCVSVCPSVMERIWRHLSSGNVVWKTYVVVTTFRPWLCVFLPFEVHLWRLYVVFVCVRVLNMQASLCVCCLYTSLEWMFVCMYACLYLCVWLCSLNLCVWVCVVYLCVCLGTVNTTVYLPLQPCDVSTRTAGLLKPAVAACHLHLHTSTQQSLEASCSTHPSSAACCLANSS